MQNSQDSIEIRFNNRRLIPVLTLISLFLGIFIGGLGVFVVGKLSQKESAQQNLTNTTDYYNPEFINQITNILEERYLGDFSDLSKDDATYGMVKGLISALGDRYTLFLDPKQASEYFQQSSGDFEGIGVTLSFNGQYTYVESVIKEHPAEKAGVLPGDIILRVDDQDVQDILPGIVAQKIRGEKGTNVKLSLARIADKVSEQPGEIELTITRNSIKVDNITWKSHDEKTAIIEIVQFNDETVKKFTDSWDSIVEEVNKDIPGLENIVVDLRGNPGGYVYGVKYILEEFLADGEILMMERTKDNKDKTFTDERKGDFESVKLIVLVDEGSASASEIFASAIQDNERGLIIGEKTVGKGVEQEVIDLPDGSLLMVVFQQWLTPNGRNINPETPITPDILVEYSFENFKTNTDPQLDRALEELY